MFGKSLTLFKLAGFKVRVDASWLILALFVTWTFAEGVLPAQLPRESTTVYWLLGGLVAIGLFASVILHEIAHAVIARREGIPIRGITLFIFGGVAEMEDEPPNGKAEFWMAIAGPIMSFFLAGVFFLPSLLFPDELPPAMSVVLGLLAWLNLVLAVFNMVPAFPLDGGRVFRALMWSWKGDLVEATRIASVFGNVFALFLIALGALSFVSGNLVGGLWWFMIGLFLRAACKASYHQVLMGRVMQGEQVRRFMKEDPITVPPDATISELVNDYVLKYHFKTFPVVTDGKLLGCVTTREIKQRPQDTWNSVKVEELMSTCNEGNTISPDADAMEALRLMSREGLSRLMVTENGELRGVVALRDMLSFLTLKLELEAGPGDLQQALTT